MDALIRIVNICLGTIISIYLILDLVFQVNHIPLFFSNRPFFYLLNLNEYKTFEFKTNFFEHSYIGKSTDYIDASVLIHGGYENETLFLMRDLMKARSHPGTFVDVGANVGQHSLFMSTHANMVHSFDPYEPVLRRFREMIDLNEITNIKIHAVGLGEQKATIPFFAPSSGNQGQGSFIHSDVTESKSSMKLQVERGDEYFPANGIESIDLIKIDIEGYEKSAILGLSEILKRERPFIVMELNFGDDEKFRNIEEVVNLLPKQYRYFRYRQENAGGCYDLKTVDAKTSSDIRGLVAIPEEDFANISFTGSC